MLTPHFLGYFVLYTRDRSSDMLRFAATSVCLQNVCFMNLQIILFNATWLFVHHQAEKYPHILESSMPCTDFGLITYLPSAQSPITYIE
ncbi:unnamed protein product [Schistosoma bovis]|nr:unnamed protein product [Schistosoma bovis]CAH8635697.1 unnamed protein product [Schistosoma bovis]